MATNQTTQAPQDLIMKKGSLLIYSIPSLEELQVTVERKKDGAKVETKVVELVHPSKKSWLSKWRNRMRAVVLSHGVCIADAVAYVTDDSLDGKSASLQTDIVEMLAGRMHVRGGAAPISFTQDRDDFCNNLDQYVEEQLKAQTDPEIRQIIEDNRPDANRFRALQVSYRDLAIGAAKVVGGNDVFNPESMVGAIACEIAQDVKNTWDEEAKSSNQNIRNLLNRCASKCKKLSFIDNRVAGIGIKIAEIAAKLPTEGKIEGTDFTLLRSLLLVMKDPKKLLTDLASITGVDNEDQLNLTLAQDEFASLAPAPASNEVVVVSDPEPAPAAAVQAAPAEAPAVQPAKVEAKARKKAATPAKVEKAPKAPKPRKAKKAAEPVVDQSLKELFKLPPGDEASDFDTGDDVRGDLGIPESHGSSNESWAW